MKIEDVGVCAVDDGSYCQAALPTTKYIRRKKRKNERKRGRKARNGSKRRREKEKKIDTLYESCEHECHNL